MKTTKTLFIAISIILSSLQIFAQQHGGGGNGRNMPAEGTLTGKIIESATNTPMEYVSVVAYYVRDSSMITGGLTNAEGVFNLKNLKYGKYYLEIKFLGFDKKIVQDVKVTPKQKDVDVGEIQLTATDSEIGEVVVEADKRHIEYKIDKKVINVSQDLTAVGGSAVDVLENTPSVETDIDGNVSIRGSSNFTVLINGKPSVLDGSDALQQIPAATIEQIEIITNPSAKYDPDGVGGIINVITKQKKEQGFNGIINLSANTHMSYSGDATFNYKIGKFNFFVGGDYNVRNHPGEGYLEQRTYYDTMTYYLFTDSERNWKRNGYKANAGFDYYINDNNTLTLSGEYGYRDFGMDMTNQSYEYMLIDEAKYEENYFQRATLFNIFGFSATGDINFEHRFKQKGHKLNLFAYYSMWDADEINSLDQDTTNSNYEITGVNQYKQKSDETKDRSRYRIELSYEKPVFKNHKIEAGYTGRFDRVLSGYNFFTANYTDAEQYAWVEDQSQANDLDFKNYIQAAYGIFSGEYKTFGYQAGLRTEYTDRLIAQGDKKYPIKRFDFFPSVHLSKQFPGENQLQASYSRRINRPRGWYLNPFPFYIDQRNARSGNPELSPEYIDSYELNYMKRFMKMSFFSLEGYYRQTNDKIERIQYLTDEGIMLSTFDNLSKDYSIGLEGMTNLMLSKWLIINLSGNVYQYNIDGEILDEEVTKSTFMWSSRGNLTIKLKTNTRFQLTGFYRAPSITTQGEMDDFFMTNAAVRQDLFKKKLSITFKVRDIFNTMNHNFTSETATFYSYNERSHLSPVFSFNLSYKLNNYKSKDKGRQGGDGGEGEEF